jgi:uncharacterized phage protein (TIGR01671 family)
MREILFRGRYEVIDYKTRTVSFKWAEGCLDTTNRNYVIFSGVSARFAVDPETVGQYTGLTDKNGNKIFEGDIVRVKNGIKEEDFVGSIVYEYASWEIDYGCDMVSLWTVVVELKEDRTVEVIGNIHDNPELLEREKGGRE